MRLSALPIALMPLENNVFSYISSSYDYTVEYIEFINCHMRYCLEEGNL